MKIKVFLGCFLFLIVLSACNRNAKRYNNATTINPELIGTWVSQDNCSLELKKENNVLILVKFHNNKNQQINNIPLNFKMFSITTELSNKNPSGPTFIAKYIDGAIIIDNICQPLQKIQ